jgi:hypothetical protein
MNEQLIAKLNELAQYELEQGNGYGSGGASMEEVKHIGKYHGSYISVDELCEKLGLTMDYSGNFSIKSEVCV